MMMLEWNLIANLSSIFSHTRKSDCNGSNAYKFDQDRGIITGAGPGPAWLLPWFGPTQKTHCETTVSMFRIKREFDSHRVTKTPDHRKVYINCLLIKKTTAFIDILPSFYTWKFYYYEKSTIDP
jgi:hypothetical protein